MLLREDVSAYTGALVERTSSTVVAAQRAAVLSAAALAKVSQDDSAALLRVATQMKLSFVDLAFPPDASSEVGGADPAQWLRLRDAAVKAGGGSAAACALHPASDRVHALAVPGLCSNRWWLSLLLLCGDAARLVPGLECRLGAGGGSATVRLPHPVIVDDFVPWRKGSPLHALCTPTPSADLWVALVEKALAKQTRTYARLSATVTSLNEAVRSLGGVLHEAPFRDGAGAAAVGTFLQHARGGSLLLLRPRQAAATGVLQQTKALYTVAAFEEGSTPRVLLYCPVVEQPVAQADLASPRGQRAVDAQWMSTATLPTLFQSWGSVTEPASGQPWPIKNCPVELSRMMTAASLRPADSAAQQHRRAQPHRQTPSHSPLPRPHQLPLETAPTVTSPTVFADPPTRSVSAASYRSQQAVAPAPVLPVPHSRVEQLEKENAALTQLHIDALMHGGGAGGGSDGASHRGPSGGVSAAADEMVVDRVKLLKATLARLQAESERKMAYELTEDGGVLHALGRRWVPCDAGSGGGGSRAPDAAALVERCRRDVEHAERARREEALGYEQQLAAGRREADARVAAVEAKTSALLEAQRDHITELCGELQARPAAGGGGGGGGGDALLAELERTVRALTAELGAAQAEARAKEMLGVELLEARDRAAALQTQLELARHGAPSEDDALRAAVAEREEVIRALEAEVQQARRAAAAGDGAAGGGALLEHRCREQAETLRASEREASALATELDRCRCQLAATRDALTAARVEADDARLAAGSGDSELRVVQETVRRQAATIVAQEGGIDGEGLAVLTADYQQKLEACHANLQEREAAWAAEKKGLITVNAKAWAAFEEDIAALKEAKAALETQAEEAAEKLRAAEEELGVLRARVPELEARVAGLEAEGAAKDKQAAALQASLVETQGKLSAKEEEAAAHKMAAETTRITAEADRTAAAEIREASMARLQQEVAELKQTIEGHRADKAKLKEALREAEAETEAVRKEVKKARDEIWQLSQQNQALEKKLEHATARVAELVLETQELAAAKAEAREEAVALNTKLCGVQNELTAATGANQELRTEAEGLKEAIFKGDDAIKVAKETIATLEEAKRGLEEELLSTKTEFESAVIAFEAQAKKFVEDIAQLKVCAWPPDVTLDFTPTHTERSRNGQRNIGASGHRLDVLPRRIRRSQNEMERPRVRNGTPHSPFANARRMRTTTTHPQEERIRTLEKEGAEAAEREAALEEEKTALVRRCDAYSEETIALKTDLKASADRVKDVEDALLGEARVRVTHVALRSLSTAHTTQSGVVEQAEASGGTRGFEDRQKITNLEVRLAKSLKSKELLRSTMEDRLESYARRLHSSEEENEALRREMVLVLAEGNAACPTVQRPVSMVPSPALLSPRLSLREPSMLMSVPRSPLRDPHAYPVHRSNGHPSLSPERRRW